MSQHNPDTAAYEQTIQDLHSQLRDCRRLVQDYLTEHAQLVMIEHNAVRCCCGLCGRARTVLEKD